MSNLNDAEQLKRLIVQPMIDAVNASMEGHMKAMDAKLEGLVTSVNDHKTRIEAIEAGRKKAMIGYGVYATGTSIAIGAGWNWLKKKIGAA